MDIKEHMPQRAPILVALPCIIVGLLLSRHYTPFPLVSLSAALCLGTVSLWLAKKCKPTSWLLTFMAATTLGFWAYGNIRLPALVSEAELSVPPREARLKLQVERVMQAENEWGKATGIAKVLKAPETSQLERNNRVYFRLSKEDTSLLSGARSVQFQATGVLSPIDPGAGKNSFDNYLQGLGIQHKFDRTSQIVVLRPASVFENFCRKMNQRFQDYLRLGEPENSKLSSIYIAMLLGLKTELTEGQTDRFRMTGTMHLFAISGLHIGVVATVIAQSLLLIRLPKPIRPIIGLPLLYLYVEITGGAPSAVRAFLMVAFFWASLALQRQRSPMAALAASAVFVLLIQPNQLWQMGFQLSYLVVLSILTLGLPLHEAIWKRFRPCKYLPESNWSRYQHILVGSLDKLLLLFTISFSAWLASAPLSAGLFGFIAPYAVAVNMLLVNLAALVISGGVISLVLATSGLPVMAAFLNHAAWVGISMMDAIVKMNVALPGAIMECPDFPSTVSYMSLIIYFGLLCLLARTKYGGLRFILAPLVIVISLLTGLVMN